MPGGKACNHQGSARQGIIIGDTKQHPEVCQANKLGEDITVVHIRSMNIVSDFILFMSALGFEPFEHTTY